MTTHARLLEQFGSEEKISEYYRELSRKSREPGVRVLPHKGGFNYNRKEAIKWGQINGKRSKRGKSVKKENSSPES
jgi:hypothetical protein